MRELAASDARAVASPAGARRQRWRTTRPRQPRARAGFPYNKHSWTRRWDVVDRPARLSLSSEEFDRTPAARTATARVHSVAGGGQGGPTALTADRRCSPSEEALEEARQRGSAPRSTSREQAPRTARAPTPSDDAGPVAVPGIDETTVLLSSTNSARSTASASADRALRGRALCRRRVRSYAPVDRAVLATVKPEFRGPSRAPLI